MEVKSVQYNIKTPIREVFIDSLKIGDDKSLSFMSESGNKTKPLFALEIPFFKDNSCAEILKSTWSNQDKDFNQILGEALDTDADIICIKFNIDENDIKKNLESSVSELVKAIKDVNKPLMVKGTNNKNIDKIILPKLAEAIKKQVIIAIAEETTYEEIVPEVVKNNHLLVLRSPIDINLAKELNILSMELGLSVDKILIDTDMGALGYGMDYGYSMIEKVKQAGLEGDEKLNMPIVSFVGEETFKIKETKIDSYDKNWGDYNQRAIMWEISTASAIISAGSNVVVVQHPQTIETLKDLLWD